MSMQNPQVRVWRERAEELRVIADGFADPTARSDLVDLAAKWDKMADRAQAAPPRKDRDGKT